MSNAGREPRPPLDRPWIRVQFLVWVIVLVTVGVLVRHGYDAGVAISLVATTAAVSAEVARRLFAPGFGHRYLS